MLGLLAPLLLGEAFVRLRPPADLQDFLGDDSLLAGIYKPDPDLSVDYRSFEDFRALNEKKFAELGALDDATRPTWAFLGPSFAGNLGQTAHDAMPAYRIYFDIRDIRYGPGGAAKDQFHLWIAQVRLLLAQGFRPQRIFFVLIPQEFARYSDVPLDWFYVTRSGAINTRVRLPAGPLGRFIDTSRLALVGWTRAGLHRASSGVKTKDITESVPDTVTGDFRRMFGVLGALQKQYGVPITLVLLPDRRQVFDPSKFALQRTMAPIAQQAGLDVFDAAPTLLAYPDKHALYIPDWHYTPLGNQLLLDALRAHVATLPAPTP